MKLYEVKPGSKIRVSHIASETEHPPAHRDFDQQEVLTFIKIDGAYSLCTDRDGKLVHLGASAEVEVI